MIAINYMGEGGSLKIKSDDVLFEQTLMWVRYMVCQEKGVSSMLCVFFYGGTITELQKFKL